MLDFFCLMNSPLGIKDALLFKNLGDNGDSRVDRVGNDQNVGLGSVLGHTLDQIADNASIDLEEV